MTRYKKYLSDYLFLFLVSGLIIAADQWTKALVRANLGFNDYWMPWDWLAPYARIVHWKNTGAAFGMLQDFGSVFAVLAFLVSLFIIYYFPQIPRQEWTLRWPMCLLLAGALGNLIDRVHQGWVTDFISVGNFAVFNIADASISVGAVLMGLAIAWKEWEAQTLAERRKLAAQRALTFRKKFEKRSKPMLRREYIPGRFLKHKRAAAMRSAPMAGYLRPGRQHFPFALRGGAG